MQGAVVVIQLVLVGGIALLAYKLASLFFRPAGTPPPEAGRLLSRGWLPETLMPAKSSARFVGEIIDPPVNGVAVRNPFGSEYTVQVEIDASEAARVEVRLKVDEFAPLESGPTSKTYSKAVDLIQGRNFASFAVPVQHVILTGVAAVATLEVEGRVIGVSNYTFR